MDWVIEYHISFSQHIRERYKYFNSGWKQFFSNDFGLSVSLEMLYALNGPRLFGSLDHTDGHDLGGWFDTRIPKQIQASQKYLQATYISTENIKSHQVAVITSAIQTDASHWQSHERHSKQKTRELNSTWTAQDGDGIFLYFSAFFPTIVIILLVELTVSFFPGPIRQLL